MCILWVRLKGGVESTSWGSGLIHVCGSGLIHGWGSGLIHGWGSGLIHGWGSGLIHGWGSGFSHIGSSLVTSIHLFFFFFKSISNFMHTRWYLYGSVFANYLIYSLYESVFTRQNSIATHILLLWWSRYGQISTEDCWWVFISGLTSFLFLWRFSDGISIKSSAGWLGS